MEEYNKGLESGEATAVHCFGKMANSFCAEQAISLHGGHKDTKRSLGSYFNGKLNYNVFDPLTLISVFISICF